MQNMDGSPMRNFYSQDGEAEILTPAMDAAAQAAFEGDRLYQRSSLCHWHPVGPQH